MNADGDRTISLLLIEDDDGDVALIDRMLRGGRERFRLERAESAGAGIERLDEESFDLILLDLTLPDSMGLDSVERVYSAASKVPIIVLTGLADDELPTRAVRGGAQDYLVKGQLDREILLRSVRYAIARKRAEDALREREEQLRQSQKLEAVGSLAGGVAHDFNNLLTVIMSCCEFVREAVEHDEQALEDIDQIAHTSQRAIALTRQLLAFSRRHPTRPETVDLNELIVQLDKMLRRLIGSHISLITVPEEGLWAVEVDRAQFEQVVTNLVINARDALPEGGTIRIATHNARPEREEAVRLGIPEGDYVVLSVTDDGCGIAPEVKEHIFEPFYTTKGTGYGTGLGLSTCYGIVTQAGGVFSLVSEPDAGSSFTVYLPRSERAPSARADEADAEASASLGRESVLVVEDDDDVRRLAVRTLVRCGYDVLQASNAGEALLLCEPESRTIDLLVADLVMPQVGGYDLASRLRALRPGLRTLFMSGYANRDAAPAAASRPVEAALLHKPFTPAELAAAVRHALDD